MKRLMREIDSVDMYLANPHNWKAICRSAKKRHCFQPWIAETETELSQYHPGQGEHAAKARKSS